MERCAHGHTKWQGCRECVPSLDWREDYERIVYGGRIAQPEPRREPMPELGELHDICGIDPHYGTRGL